MLKIKQALERAKSERAAAIPIAAGEASKEMPTRRTDAGYELSAPIQYTQTQVIDVGVDVWKRNRLLHDGSDAQASAAYKMLRTRVLQRLAENNWNSVAVTSSLPGEGKTLTAVNLAISLSREVDKTVLLVDFDLARPGVHRCFDVNPIHDLSDFIYHGVELKDILFTPGLDGLVVLPGGKPLINTSELLSSPRMRAMVEELKSRYPSRIVVFDLPPLLVTDDAMAFAPYVDSVLLVIEEGRSTRRQLQQSLEMLKTTHVLGTVLNKSHEKTVTGY